MLIRLTDMFVTARLDTQAFTVKIISTNSRWFYPGVDAVQMTSKLEKNISGLLSDLRKFFLVFNVPCRVKKLLKC